MESSDAEVDSPGTSQSQPPDTLPYPSQPKYYLEPRFLISRKKTHVSLLKWWSKNCSTIFFLPLAWLSFIWGHGSANCLSPIQPQLRWGKLHHENFFLIQQLTDATTVPKSQGVRVAGRGHRTVNSNVVSMDEDLSIDNKETWGQSLTMVLMSSVTLGKSPGSESLFPLTRCVVDNSSAYLRESWCRSKQNNISKMLSTAPSA